MLYWTAVVSSSIEQLLLLFQFFFQRIFLLENGHFERQVGDQSVLFVTLSQVFAKCNLNSVCKKLNYLDLFKIFQLSLAKNSRCNKKV